MMNAVDFVTWQPRTVHLEMIRAAARNQDVVTLQILDAAGVFSLEAPGSNSRSVNETHYLFSPKEFGAIASLGSVCETAELLFSDNDWCSGEPIEGLAKMEACRIKVLNQDFCPWLLGLVERYIGEARSWLAASDDASVFKRYARERHQATLGVLLATAAALDDVSLARLVCQELGPGALSTPGIQANLWLSSRLVNAHSSEPPRMLQPALMALRAASQGVMDLLLEYGWSPHQPLMAECLPTTAPVVAFHDMMVEGRNVRSSARHYGIETTLHYLTTPISNVTPQPSMMARLLPMLKDEQGNYSEPQWRELLKQWSLNLLTEPDAFPLDMIKCALNAGVYEIDAGETMSMAARNGVREVMDHVADRLDWATLSPSANPLEGALDSSLWSDERDRMETLSLYLMKLMIGRGRGDLLVQPGRWEPPREEGTFVPIIECVRNGFGAGVLLCLEQGADPWATNHDGEDVVSLAAEHGHGEIIELVRSYKAKRFALQAVDELQASKVQGVGWRATGM